MKQANLVLIFCGLFCGLLISFLVFISINNKKIRTENENQIEIELKKRDSLCKQQLEKQSK